MTLFGTTLDGQQVAGLVGLLVMLAFWVFVLRREQGYAKWFKQREAGRKSRREEEQGGPPPDQPGRGPWG